MPPLSALIFSLATHSQVLFTQPQQAIEDQRSSALLYVYITHCTHVSATGSEQQPKIWSIAESMSSSGTSPAAEKRFGVSGGPLSTSLTNGCVPSTCWSQAFQFSLFAPAVASSVAGASPDFQRAAADTKQQPPPPPIAQQLLLRPAVASLDSNFNSSALSYLSKQSQPQPALAIGAHWSPFAESSRVESCVRLAQYSRTCGRTRCTVELNGKLLGAARL